MKLITFANRKGGCGKSTSTVLLASVLSQQLDAKVVVVDMDDQQSIGKQWERRHSDESVKWDFLPLKTPMTSETQFLHFKEYIDDNCKDYDFVLLDTAGRLSRGGQEHKVLEMSDVICVPIVPTSLTWEDTMEYFSFMLGCNLKKDVRIVSYVNQYVNNRKRCAAVKNALCNIVEEDERFTVLNNSLNFLEEIAAMPLSLPSITSPAQLNIYNWACEIKQAL